MKKTQLLKKKLSKQKFYSKNTFALKKSYKNKQLRNKKKLKKTNKIYLIQNGGGIETAKNYFVSNYSKLEEIKQITEDEALQEFIKTDIEQLIQISEEEKKELVVEYLKKIDDMEKQIEILKKKQDKQKAIEKLENTKEDLTKKHTKKISEIDNIIYKLNEININRNIDEIYSNPDVLFFAIIAYLKMGDNTKCDIDKVIDLFVKFYLNGSMGNPNSIENFGRLVDSIGDFELLIGQIDDEESIKSINDFDGLTGSNDNEKKYLETFLDKLKYKTFLDEHKQLKLKEAKEKEGADKLINIHSDNGSIVVYLIKTIEAAKYYGRRTKWCTAAEHNNMFDAYERKGNLYIIQIKLGEKQTEKYQLHIEYNEFKNEQNEDKDITEFIKDVSQIFRHETFLEWFYKNYLFNLLKFSEDSKTLRVPKYIDKKIFTYLINFNEKKESDLINLQNLIFGVSFNQPLGDSLNVLTNLQHLTFGASFNQPLGDSLNGLSNLQKLIFGYSFNQPLGDSLNGLEKLKSLTFGNNFNQPLGDSLKNLKELQNLSFGIKFDRKYIGDSLEGLKNLNPLNP